MINDNKIEKIAGAVGDTPIDAIEKLKNLIEQMDLTPEESKLVADKVAHLVLLNRLANTNKEELRKQRDERRLEIITSMPARSDLEQLNKRPDKIARKLLRGK